MSPAGRLEPICHSDTNLTNNERTIMNPTDYNEILELLKNYYDGLYRLDTKLLGEVFSPTAQYATIANGELLTLAIDEYLPRLEQRDSPEKDKVPYGSSVVSIHFAGKNTALAEVQATMFGHHYTDFLSLLKIDGQWRIQAKVFEGVPTNN